MIATFAPHRIALDYNSCTHTFKYSLFCFDINSIGDVMCGWVACLCVCTHTHTNTPHLIWFSFLHIHQNMRMQHTFCSFFSFSCYYIDSFFVLSRLILFCIKFHLFFLLNRFFVRFTWHATNTEQSDFER